MSAAPPFTTPGANIAVTEIALCLDSTQENQQKLAQVDL